MRWLSNGDFEETHYRHYKKRFQNTGQWLLDDPRLLSWQDNTQSGLLWCHGARMLPENTAHCYPPMTNSSSFTAGSGKTVLAYAPEDHLKDDISF